MWQRIATADKSRHTKMCFIKISKLHNLKDKQINNSNGKTPK